MATRRKTGLLQDYYRIKLSEILDNVIIKRQEDFLSTSNYQFGFKAKSSTVLCTTMVNETIQYYTEKGGRVVYLLLLDAFKAFDKVSYKKLFEMLLARNVCPKIVKLLYYMYTHRKCHVRWNKKQSDPFSVSNGVKLFRYLASTEITYFQNCNSQD